MKRCARCVLPSSFPGITFDDQGLCNFCKLPKNVKPLLSHKLLGDKIKSALSIRKPYDCIVPLSGGRDSSYILYLAKFVLGLNVLAVNYNNEFRTTMAKENIDKICNSANVRYVSIKSKNYLAKKIVRNKLRMNLKIGNSILTQGVCSACSFSYRSLVYKIAVEKNIPLIFWGSSPFEDTSILRNFIKQKKPTKNVSFKKHYFSTEKYLSVLYFLMLKKEFHVPGDPYFHIGRPILKHKHIYEIFLFDYFEYNPNLIVNTITSKLGWQKSNAKKSSWRIDCKLTKLIDYSYFKSYGCSKACLGYHNLINHGLLNREDALSAEEHSYANYTTGIEELLSRDIGLNSSEISLALSR